MTQIFSILYKFAELRSADNAKKNLLIFNLRTVPPEKFADLGNRNKPQEIADL